MSVIARIVTPRDLMNGDRDAMFMLMDRHFENMNRSKFDADLSEKDWVLLLIETDSAQLCGFSTQVLLPVDVNGRTVKCVFSGDTIVDRDHWGSSALSTAFGKLACHWIETHPGQELYWFLISKGFRTYRVLPVYFREFFPRYDATVPSHLQEVLDTVSQARFPDRYDPACGIVRAKLDSDRLRSGVGDITPERMQDPHVRFFAERNPGHLHGDELCCIARLCTENFSSIAQRLIRSAAFAGQQIGPT